MYIEKFKDDEKSLQELEQTLSQKVWQGKEVKIDPSLDGYFRIYVDDNFNGLIGDIEACAADIDLTEKLRVSHNLFMASKFGDEYMEHVQQYYKSHAKDHKNRKSEKQFKHNQEAQQLFEEWGNYYQNIYSQIVEGYHKMKGRGKD